MLVTVMVLLIVVLLVLLSVTVVFQAAAGRNQVPVVFTPSSALDEVVEALDLFDGGRLVDLGCGDGRVLEAALTRQPEVLVKGVENNPVVLLLARRRLGKRAELLRANLTSVDLDDADRVFAYLSPELMAELEPKFERELKAGARLVSQQFPLPHRRVDREVNLGKGSAYAKRLYVYDY